MRHFKGLLLTGVSLCVSTTAWAQQADDTNQARDAELNEITVTATRRTESLQDVPIAVRALSEEQLDQLGVNSFEDYAKLIPGLVGAGQGPGKQDIIIRGISPGRLGVRVSGISFEPSVAFYIDETPISTGGRNIDLYAADLSRIEVLKGPQGTLFGASSQAGNVRLITNEPKLSSFEAGGNFGISSTRGGERSYNVEAFLNVPIVEDKLALRVVGYTSTEGGFVDNIAASRELPLFNPGLNPGLLQAFAAAGFAPTRDNQTIIDQAAALGLPPLFIPGSREAADNISVVEDDFNDAVYEGFRASLLWQINPDWSARIMYANQSLETEGVFEFEPEISEDGDFAVRSFAPSEGNDDVSITTWTVQGRLANLDLIYNGSYTDRNFEGQTDYTGYADIGPFIPYYICTPGYTSCGSPVLFTDEIFETERQTHELRVSTPQTNRYRLIAGVFYDDQSTIERTDFIYPASTLVGFIPSFPNPAAFATNPNPRPNGTTFFNDFLREREEISFFGEAEFDLLDTVTARFGARYYEIEQNFTGQARFGTRFPGTPGQNVDANLAGFTPATESDVIFKAGLDWKVTPDALLYASYGEGFRAGGFNRAGNTGPNPDNQVPPTFESDTLTSYEIGWKTQWLNNRLRFNGAAFLVNLDNIQQGVLDFSITNTAIFLNVGSARQIGLEFDFEWLVNDNLTIFGAGQFLDSELTDLPPTLVDTAPLGSKIAYSPDFTGVGGARYTQDFGKVTGFFQGLVNYTGERFTSIAAGLDAVVSPLIEDGRFILPEYTQVDLTAGVQTDQWSATLFADNVTDTQGLLFATANDGIIRGIPTRPRTVGLRFSLNY